MKKSLVHCSVTAAFTSLAISSASAAPMPDTSFSSNLGNPTATAMEVKKIYPLQDGGYILGNTGRVQKDRGSPCEPVIYESKGLNLGYHNIYPVVKVNANGRMDCDFKLEATGTNAMYILPDGNGKLYVDGALAGGIGLYSSYYVGEPNKINTHGFAIARFLEENGALDGYFVRAREPETGIFFGDFYPPHKTGWLYHNVFVMALEQSSAIPFESKLVVAGKRQYDRNVPLKHVWRINPDGSYDQSFQASGLNKNQPSHDSGYIGKIRTLPSGDILIGGGFTDVEGVDYRSLVRLNADGTLDTNFRVAANNLSDYSGFNHGLGDARGVRDFAVQPNGKIIAVGQFSKTVNGKTIRNIARLNSDGSLDESFNLPAFMTSSSRGSNTINSVALQSDGRVILASDMSYDAATGMSPLLRLNADGSLDETFRAAPKLTGFGNSTAVHHAVFDNECRLMVTLRTNGNYLPVIDMPLTGMTATANTGFTRLIIDDSPGCTQ